MKKLFIAAFLAFSFAAFTSAANAAVIDFNSALDQYWISTYTESGFQFSLAIADGMGTLTSDDMPGYWYSNGTGHLETWTNVGDDSGFVLTAIGGGSFSLDSLDFGNGYVAGNEPTSGLTVTGSLTGGGTITQNFSYSGPGSITASFGDGWNALDSVLVDSHGSENRTFFDNVVVDAHESDRVPDVASTLGLVMLSFAGLVAFRRRKS
jgi:hypothetical protein